MSFATRIFSGQISDFDLRLIRTFRAVADCGGFSLAEVELRMTKSAISKQISDLEVRLGVQLCHRGRSGFALTTEGQTLYKASTRLFGEIEGFLSFGRDVSEMRKAELARVQAEERFRTAFEHAPIGLAITGLVGEQRVRPLVGHGREMLDRRPQ